MTKPKFDEPGFLSQMAPVAAPKAESEIIEEPEIESTGSILIQPPKKPEPFDQRLVANVTKSQKKYVQRMAKNFENESAFIRYVIDLLMANAKLEGK